MNWKCLFGHKWEKRGGAMNVGDGNFKQEYICKRCGKIKEIIS